MKSNNIRKKNFKKKKRNRKKARYAENLER